MLQIDHVETFDLTPITVSYNLGEKPENCKLYETVLYCTNTRNGINYQLVVSVYEGVKNTYHTIALYSREHPHNTYINILEYPILIANTMGRL